MTWKPYFQNFQNPSNKNLNLQVKMYFATKILRQGRTDFTDTSFRFYEKQRFSAMFVFSWGWFTLKLFSGTLLI